MRASDRDRDATTGVLQTAFAEGRLGSEEYEERIGQALTARTYAELRSLTADLPRWQPRPPDQRPQRTNPLAIAALACAAAQPFTGMLTTIPAIVFGHMARHQIRRSGEDGAAMATWGLALGWAGVALPVVLVLLITLTVGHLLS